MLITVTCSTEIGQEFRVHRNWEGDEKATVHIEVFEEGAGDADEKKAYSLYVTVKELEELVKAAKIITEDAKGNNGDKRF